MRASLWIGWALRLLPLALAILALRGFPIPPGWPGAMDALSAVDLGIINRVAYPGLFIACLLIGVGSALGPEIYRALATRKAQASAPLPDMSFAAAVGYVLGFTDLHVGDQRAAKDRWEEVERLCRVLKQRASAGDLASWGRTPAADASGEPALPALLPIPAEHWARHEIDLTYFYEKQGVRTQPQGVPLSSDTVRFTDIAFNTVQIQKFKKDWRKRRTGGGD
jgi:hypothetical protein